MAEIYVDGGTCSPQGPQISAKNLQKSVQALCCKAFSETESQPNDLRAHPGWASSWTRRRYLRARHRRAHDSRGAGTCSRASFLAVEAATQPPMRSQTVRSRSARIWAAFLSMAEERGLPSDLYGRPPADATATSNRSAQGACSSLCGRRGGQPSDLCGSPPRDSASHEKSGH